MRVSATRCRQIQHEKFFFGGNQQTIKAGYQIILGRFYNICIKNLGVFPFMVPTGSVL